MNYNLITNLNACVSSTLSMLNNNLNLLYYSHIPTIIISLFFGFFVLIKSRYNLLSKIFLVLTFLFSLWSILDLFTWLDTDTRVVMFTWAMTGLIETLLFIFSFYFVYVFIEKKDVGYIGKTSWVLLLTPLIVWMSTNLNLYGFNVIDCYSLENNYSLYYKYFLEILSIIFITIFCLFKIRKTGGNMRKQIILLYSGITLFLVSFFSSVFVAGYLEELGIVTGYGFEIYGLFGAIIFMAFLVFIIVKFKAFNIKLIGAQALTWALVIFIGSQFLYMDKMPTSSIVITAITLVMSAGIGLMIVRGVKKEIAIREKIESLADQLEHTNERLRELDQQKTQFVSLATHQLRAPLTSIKGYLSMILEGDYGEINNDAREMIKRVLDSSSNLVTIVGDFLDVSRIEQGVMRYEWKDFDLKGLVETVYSEQKLVAEKKGLNLAINIESGTTFNVHADMNKIKQVFTNLVDNSIKYTPAGEVKISLTRPLPTTVRFEVSDTGIGIAPEAKEKIFQKFTRAEGANEVNVIGTGLGLFVAKEMIKAHEGGKIWAESEGKGKGSKFIVELKAL